MEFNCSLFNRRSDDELKDIASSKDFSLVKDELLNFNDRTYALGLHTFCCFQKIPDPSEAISTWHHNISNLVKFSKMDDQAPNLLRKIDRIRSQALHICNEEEVSELYDFSSNSYSKEFSELSDPEIKFIVRCKSGKESAVIVHRSIATKVGMLISLLKYEAKSTYEVNGVTTHSFLRIISFLYSGILHDTICCSKGNEEIDHVELRASLLEEIGELKEILECNEYLHVPYLTEFAISKLRNLSEVLEGATRGETDLEKLRSWAGNDPELSSKIPLSLCEDRCTVVGREAFEMNRVSACRVSPFFRLVLTELPGEWKDNQRLAFRNIPSSFFTSWLQFAETEQFHHLKSYRNRTESLPFDWEQLVNESNVAEFYKFAEIEQLPCLLDFCEKKISFFIGHGDFPNPYRSKLSCAFSNSYAEYRHFISGDCSWISGVTRILIHNQEEDLSHLDASVDGALTTVPKDEEEMRSNWFLYIYFLLKRKFEPTGNIATTMHALLKFQGAYTTDEGYVSCLSAVDEQVVQVLVDGYVHCANQAGRLLCHKFLTLVSGRYKVHKPLNKYVEILKVELTEDLQTIPSWGSSWGSAEFAVQALGELMSDNIEDLDKGVISAISAKLNSPIGPSTECTYHLICLGVQRLDLINASVVSAAINGLTHYRDSGVMQKLCIKIIRYTTEQRPDLIDDESLVKSLLSVRGTEKDLSYALDALYLILKAKPEMIKPDDIDAYCSILERDPGSDIPLDCLFLISLTEKTCPGSSGWRVKNLCFSNILKLKGKGIDLEFSYILSLMASNSSDLIDYRFYLIVLDLTKKTEDEKTVCNNYITLSRIYNTAPHLITPETIAIAERKLKNYPTDHLKKTLTVFLDKIRASSLSSRVYRSKLSIPSPDLPPKASKTRVRSSQVYSALPL
jgi:flagellin-specific chaperone FliS